MLKKNFKYQEIINLINTNKLQEAKILLNQFDDSYKGNSDFFNLSGLLSQNTN